MLSRVAESIYWMSRYTERVENITRIMDANYHMILDMPAGFGEQWEPLVVNSSQGGGSKDTWVVGAGALEERGAPC